MHKVSQILHLGVEVVLGLGTKVVHQLIQQHLPTVHLHVLHLELIHLARPLAVAGQFLEKL